MISDLGIGDVVSFEAADWDVVQLDFPHTTIQRRVDGSTRAVLTRHLLREAAERRQGELPAEQRHDGNVLLDHLDEGELDELRDLAALLDEVHSGAKTMGVAAAESGVKLKTLYRKSKRYRDLGLPGLVDRRKHRPRFRYSHLDSRLVQTIYKLADEEKEDSTGTRGRFIRRLESRLAVDFPTDTPELPSRPTMYRILEELLDGSYTFDAAATRQMNKKHGPNLFPRAVTRPGQLVQLDTTTLDVMAANGEDGAPARPFLTIAIDVATRSILAWQLSPQQPTSDDLSLLILDMITPPHLRPGWRYAAAWIRNSRGLAELVTEQDWAESVDGMPVIVPEALVVDNGGPYRDLGLRARIENLKMDLIQSRAYRPTDKPQVERAFQTINSMWCQHLPGYTGSNAGQRGDAERVEGRAFHTVDELEALLTVWIMLTYQRHPVGGLRTPGQRDETDLSPAEAFRRFVSWSGRLPVPPWPSDETFELLPRFYRRIERRGVRINNHYYDSVALNAWRGQRGPWDGRFPVGFDRRNPLHAWFRDPDGTITRLDRASTPSARTPNLGQGAPSGAPTPPPLGNSFLNAIDHSTNRSAASDARAARAALADRPDYEIAPIPAREDAPDPILDHPYVDYIEPPETYETMR